VPLAHRPGEAQVAFGEAEIHLDGQANKLALFVMTLPYSDAINCRAFPRECTEAFSRATSAPSPSAGRAAGCGSTG
jgi:hypothetical protein